MRLSKTINFVHAAALPYQTNWKKVFMKKFHWLIFSLMIFSLSACGVSLASDITPPPNYQAPVNPEPIVQSTTSPLVPPNLLNGKVIYADKCVDCHGPSGMGDGAQADQLPVPVAPIGNSEFAKNAKPSDWYQIVTVGNLDKFMPGFTSLSDRERWDVASYALSLSISDEDLELGKMIFSESCTECHAQNNAEGIVDFTNPEDLINLSLAEIISFIQNGNGSTMSGFQEILTADEISAAAAYVRSLSFTDSGELPAAENNTESNPSAENPAGEVVAVEQFSVSGELENLEPIPADQTVLLVGYDGMNQAIQLEAPVNSNGQYQFLDLDYVEGRVYQIIAIIDGVQHASEVFHNPVMDENGFVNIPVVVMESTTDASKLYAERMHVFFEFIDADTLQVVELLIIQNPSNQVVVPEDPNTPVIRYQLPEGATNLQFEEGAIGDRYILTDNGFGDLEPVEPNIPKQFLFAYNIPYENKMTLGIDLPMDVDASIVMLPADMGVEIKSDQLSFTGEQSMQGAAIQTYSSGKLSNDTNLTLNFQGKYKSNTEITGIGTTDTVGIVIGIVVLLGAIVAGVVILRGKKSNPTEEEWVEPVDSSEETDINDLLDSVIALDDAFAKGDLPEEAYQNRRQEIIQQITKLQGE